MNLRMTLAASIVSLVASGAGIASAADLRLHALLDGASVVSATESKGTGEAIAILGDDDKLRLTMVYGGLETNVTGASLNMGSSSENGAVILPLDVPVNRTSGAMVDAELTVPPDAASAMRIGNTYILVETTDHPAGAIRGQLTPQPVRLRDAAVPVTPPR
jgi:hypothetical protein